MTKKSPILAVKLNKMTIDWKMLFQIVISILLPVGVLLSVMIWSIKNGIVPMPTSRRQTRCILQNLPVDPGPNIYELGSGFGTLAISLARNYPNSVIWAIESSPIPYWISCFLRWILRVRNLKFRRADINETNVSEASAIVVYLHRAGIRRLKSKLEQEVESGVWIVSNTFAFPDWKPYKIVNVGDLHRTKIYVYKS